jgi:hypothetical protein
MTPDDAARAVRAVIGRRVAGFCYVASEAVYHLAGGRRSGLTPMVLRVEGKPPVGTHWWLEDRSVSPPRVIDVTAGQFRPPLSRTERRLGRGCEFLTRRPSVAAREIIAAVRRESCYNSGKAEDE